jgi:hypothetical protein
MISLALTGLKKMEVKQTVIHSGIEEKKRKGKQRE